jgi:F-type H+-transporting ATPase subunit b
VNAILAQLELNETFFYQLGIFIFVFLMLGNFYFKPFLKLFHARHQRTVADREAAEALMGQAQAKFDEYKARLAQERAAARAEYEALLTHTKKDETAILAAARAEAKKITQEAADSVDQQRERIRQQLESDIDSLSQQIAQTLLVRKD